MHFSVVQTYCNGVRLVRDEISAAEPIVGRLTIEDWRDGNSARRALRVARLHHPTISYHPELLLPLFDPAIVRMTETGFLLIGFQMNTAAGQTAEHAQGWWVKAAPDLPGR